MSIFFFAKEKLSTGYYSYKFYGIICLAPEINIRASKHIQKKVSAPKKVAERKVLGNVSAVEADFKLDYFLWQSCKRKED